MSEKLVMVDPSEYGIESSRAAEVEEVFRPMLEKMTELEESYNGIVSAPISPEICDQAKKLRLQYVKVRTATAKIHKKAKAFYLAGGRFVDGWKNTQKFASEGVEEKLKLIEDHYVKIEQERVEALRMERLSALSPYWDVKTEPLHLGEMEEDVWLIFLEGTKTAYENKIAAEKRAEEDRIAFEKKEEAEQEALRLENERLKEEAKKREAKELAERKVREKAEAKRAAQEAKKRAALEAKLEAERKVRAEAEAKAQKEHEAKLAAERKKREMIESGLSASEAIFAFMSWLTTRNEVVKLGGNQDSAVATELIGRFVDINNLASPRDGWTDLFVMPE